MCVRSWRRRRRCAWTAPSGSGRRSDPGKPRRVRRLMALLWSQSAAVAALARERTASALARAPPCRSRRHARRWRTARQRQRSMTMRPPRSFLRMSIVPSQHIKEGMWICPATPGATPQGQRAALPLGDRAVGIPQSGTIFVTELRCTHPVVRRCKRVVVISPRRQTRQREVHNPATT